MKYFIAISITALFTMFSYGQKNNIEGKLPQVQFAKNQIENALKNNKHTSKNVKVKFVLDTVQLKTEEFQIVVNQSFIIVKGGDAKGLMYGGLEVSEQITLYNKVSSTGGKPYIKKRGIKFNIPLDARTPSYDDTGTAAQKNIAVMWDWNFWEEYLDDLALHRYNTLTLWNPHPFPSMIKMSNYPDVALQDIYVTTLKPTGKESEWAEPQMVSKNVIENIEKVKILSIDEKISFWQKVMNRANDRGIDIYFFTWNVCPNSVATPVDPFYRTYHQDLWEEIPGKYGVTNQMNNPINVAYYKEAVKTFLLTYPYVKGIGVTAGEHMRDQLGEYNREQWIWETYGQGILEAKKVQPNRKIDFIHRVWNTNMDKVMKYWKEYPDNFEGSFKYARARLYSSPYLNFADKHMEDMKKYGLKSWWNLRNDDIFVYRWGDPNYVQAFLGHFQLSETAGFYMGSDGYVWGKEFASKNPALSGQLEIKKHWYNFMMWGRLAYNNSLDKTFFIDKLKSHFLINNAELLFSTWQSASEIIPEVNKFHWRDWDYQWSVENCTDQRTGFHEVTEFINNPTLEISNTLNPLEFAQATIKGIEINKTTPKEIVQKLITLADKSLDGAKALKSEKNSVDLKAVIDDIEAMAFLGKYYAKKIDAATELAFFQESNVQSHKANAVKLLEEAVTYWELYTTISETNYTPQMLARTNMIDWRQILEYVKEDVRIAKQFKGL